MERLRKNELFQAGLRTIPENERDRAQQAVESLFADLITRIDEVRQLAITGDSGLVIDVERSHFSGSVVVDDG
jgi:hypothetical protein